MKAPVGAIALVALALLALLAFISSPRSQDGHAQNHDWYKYLRSNSGQSCCNGDETHGDCRPVRAYLGDDGVWYAWLYGVWSPVPSDTVLKQSAPNGGSHICEQGGRIYCFIGGQPKS